MRWNLRILVSAVGVAAVAATSWDGSNSAIAQRDLSSIVTDLAAIEADVLALDAAIVSGNIDDIETALNTWVATTSRAGTPISLSSALDTADTLGLVAPVQSLLNHTTLMVDDLISQQSLLVPAGASITGPLSYFGSYFDNVVNYITNKIPAAQDSFAVLTPLYQTMSVVELGRNVLSPVTQPSAATVFTRIDGNVTFTNAKFQAYTPTDSASYIAVLQAVNALQVNTIGGQWGILDNPVLSETDIASLGPILQTLANDVQQLMNTIISQWDALAVDYIDPSLNLWSFEAYFNAIIADVSLRLPVSETANALLVQLQGILAIIDNGRNQIPGPVSTSSPTPTSATTTVPTPAVTTTSTTTPLSRSMRVRYL